MPARAADISRAPYAKMRRYYARAQRAHERATRGAILRRLRGGSACEPCVPRQRCCCLENGYARKITLYACLRFTLRVYALMVRRLPLMMRTHADDTASARCRYAPACCYAVMPRLDDICLMRAARFRCRAVTFHVTPLSADYAAPDACRLLDA